MALKLAAVTMEKAQQLTTELNDSSNDIELICTGSTMRWISLSATEHAGEFVYVSVDISKVPVEHIDCTNSLLSDLPNAVTAPDLSLPLITFVRFNNLATAIAQRPYTAYAYAAPLSRAPPLS